MARLEQQNQQLQNACLNALHIWLAVGTHGTGQNHEHVHPDPCHCHGEGQPVQIGDMVSGGFQNGPAVPEQSCDLCPDEQTAESQCSHKAFLK